jgi:hypothetical protein
MKHERMKYPNTRTVVSRRVGDGNWTLVTLG